MVVYANHLFVMIYQVVYQNINELIHLNHEILNLIEIHNMEILLDNVQESIRKKNQIESKICQKCHLHIVV